MLHKVSATSRVSVIVLAFMVYQLSAVKPRTKVHYGALVPPTNSPNACHTPLFDQITCLDLKLRGVVSVVVWRGCRSLGGGFPAVHSAACCAYPAYSACHGVLVADLGSCFAAYREACFAFRAAYPGANLVACPGASPACEPCGEIHGTRAKIRLIPAEPCCSPCRFRLAAGAGCRHRKMGEESHGVESHGGTLVEGLECQCRQGQMIGFWG